MKINFSLFAISGLFFLLSQSGAVADSGDLCRERLEKIICEVAPPVKEEDRYKPNRACLKTNPKFLAQITEAYDSYPKFIQKQFCRLDKIYIEKEFFGAAWSSPVDENKPESMLVGLRKKELEANPNLSDALTDFENQSFDSSSAVKVVVGPAENGKKTHLIQTLLHEIAHTFDYRLKFNPNWTKISWLSSGEIKPTADFPLRKKICLNHCVGKKMGKGDAAQLYSDLHSHGFISQLSAVGSMEDFAESFTYFVLVNEMGMAIEVQPADGKKVLVSELLKKPAFAEKASFLKAAVARVSGDQSF